METPADKEMREQMYKTLVALERAANAVADHFDAEKAKGEEAPTEPEPDAVEQLGMVVAKHHQALGLIATFGEFKEAGFGILDPRRSITSKLGMRACADCGGTGWIARDETCATCKRTGYIKP